MVLLDQVDNTYLRIDANLLEIGKSKDQIDAVIDVGKWKSNYTFWESKKIENKEFIRKNEDLWIEKQNGESFAKFDFISQKSDEVILYSVDRKFYLKLDSISAKWGNSINDITWEFNKGEWVS